MHFRTLKRRLTLVALLAGAMLLAGPAAYGMCAENSDDSMARLITQLGDNDYFVRERAQAELAKIGFEAFDALEAAEDNDDIEIASRAKYIVSQMQIEWTIASDPPEVKRLLQGYGMKDEAGHLGVVGQLIDLPDDKGLPVLCRLVRFDKSLLLSKLAALAIIEQKKITLRRWVSREEAIRDNLGRSPRQAAAWLRAYLDSRRDSVGAVVAWGTLAEAEQRQLGHQPPQTQPQIVCALWRQQVAALKQLDRRDEAVAAIMRIVDLEEGRSETLVELLGWLVEQEAWSVVDAVAKRFADRIEHEPLLLYALAQAQLAQGNEQAAQQMADKALALNDGTSHDQLMPHFQAALELRRRGMLKWSQREYRHVIESGGPAEVVTMYAQTGLCEMLHDQGDDEGAAKLCQDMLVVRELKDKNKDGEAQDLNTRFGTVDTLKARMHFFLACHQEAVGDRAAQLAELKKGLDHDPSEVDVLIALFRSPETDQSLKDRVRQLIHETADEFRREIRESPDEATPYNQLAWLLANTDGDAEEARRASEKSLEIVRAQSEERDTRLKEAGFLDTLGRCYYALHDYQRAVETQTRAVEFDPHSGQMRKQLKLFQSALDAQKKSVD